MGHPFSVPLPCRTHGTFFRNVPKKQARESILVCRGTPLRYGASTERARRDESLKSDPRNGIARLRLGLVTKPSTVIENMILK